MTQILTARPDKIAALDELERLIHRHIIPNLTPAQEPDLRELLRWLRSQPGDMIVAAELRTVPELQRTRLTLDITFKPLTLRTN